MSESALKLDGSLDKLPKVRKMDFREIELDSID
jgi:hypothetical protein